MLITYNDNLSECFPQSIMWGSGDAEKKVVDMSNVKTASDFGLDWDSNLVGVQFANGIFTLFAYNPNCNADPYCIDITNEDSAIYYAKHGQGVWKFKKVYNNSMKEVKTSVLNDVIRDAVILNQPPSYKGKRLKIYFVSQQGITPPKFVFNVNSKGLVHFSYERYLENKIRESFDFEGTPIQIEFKNRNEE